MFWGWVFCPSVKSRANVYTFVKKKISCSWMDSPWDLWRLKGSKWWEVLDRVCFSLWSFACVISCVLAPKCHFFQFLRYKAAHMNGKPILQVYLSEILQASKIISGQAAKCFERVVFYIWKVDSMHTHIPMWVYV